MKACILLFLVSGAALADDNAMRACRAMTDTSARLSCYDRIELSAMPAAPAAPALTPQQAFGLAPAAMAVQAPAKIDAVESTIVGPFAGWGPNTRFKLANGQVWRVVDGSDATLTPTTNPKVTIKRNFIGTIFLQVEGTNSSPKVRRVE
ncbi:hypothetical protein [Massilia sp. S19_KUP03_FR1]|uniref:hypothetical protein n=1 Tax=Massilia sp. S19_KUP03_FR1 TaxID=3025503 RepID=UPI002FCCD844